MQQVSATFDPWADDRRVSAQIDLEVVDPDAAENATATVSGSESLSAPAQVLAATAAPATKWATLEPGRWSLDGSFSILPDDTSGEDLGVWSEMSNAAGGFFAPPVLRLDLSAPASSAGFEITCDGLPGDWPDTVQIAALDGNGQTTASGIFPVTDAVQTIPLSADDYSAVEITFPGTADAYRRVRVLRFLFGIREHLTAADIVSARWIYGASADCSTFPAAELSFNFNNLGKRYNPVNPAGIYKYLQEGQTIRTALFIGGERVEMGSFYFRRAEASDNALTATITANDATWWMDGETFTGETTGSWTVADALTAILGGDFPVEISADVAALSLRKYIAEDTPVREAVRQIAQAVRCACWINRSGTLVFRDLSAAGQSVDALTPDRMPSMDGITISDRVGQVIVKSKSPYGGTTSTYISGDGTPIVALTDNPLINATATADWLYSFYQRRTRYRVQNRGNPALEIGDIVTISNAYGEAGDAVITGAELTYDGGLSAVTQAVEA